MIVKNGGKWFKDHAFLGWGKRQVRPLSIETVDSNPGPEEAWWSQSATVFGELVSKESAVYCSSCCEWSWLMFR